MTKSLIALAAALFAAGLAAPASAITFPSLTTIYIGSGVRDDGSANNVGSATVFHCSNVSGVTATIRFLVLSQGGLIEGDVAATIDHGQSYAVHTHGTVAYSEEAGLNTGFCGRGRGQHRIDPIRRLLQR